MDDRIDRLAAEIREAGRCIAFTGAGVSTASGIPDFRSEGGIWEDHDPDRFHVHAFERDPGEFWRDMLAIRDEAMPGDPEPNPAHRALARLEDAGHLDATITQNADRLHQDAGSEEVIELHGNFETAVCRSCKNRVPIDEVRSRCSADAFPPECRECEGTLKPDTVFFGEQLPEYALFRAHAHAEKSDVFLVAGSSLMVEPAASLPETAADRGASLAIVNLDETPLDDRVDYSFRQDVTSVLPELADALE